MFVRSDARMNITEKLSTSVAVNLGCSALISLTKANLDSSKPASARQNQSSTVTSRQFPCEWFLDFPKALHRVGECNLARSRLQRCPDCGRYGLGPDCSKCKVKMVAAAPIRFSPEDHQGARRRERLKVGKKEWLDSLPDIGEEE